MRIDRRQGGDERRILIGMITDPTVLAKVAARWGEGGLFASTWANTVAGWCVKYYERYRKAPRASIEGMFEHWAEREDRDKDSVAIIERFLGTLSDEYEEHARDTNSDYLIDLAGKHFTKVRLRKLKDSLEGDLDSGDIAAAEDRLAGHHRIELGGSAGVDVMSDEAAVRAAFEKSNEALVTYPGALGEFFGPYLARNALIAFQGAEKRGKTWWLLDVAWRAMLQRRRVAFFEVGDLTEDQIIRRWCTRAARHPTRPGKVKIPKEIEYSGEGIAEVSFKTRTYDTPLDWKTAVKALRATTTSRLRSKESYFKLVTHPADTINVTGIRAALMEWADDGWVADVVLIDYADILGHPGGRLEGRDIINKNWMQLAALRQELHCLVVTATQADAASYEVRTMTRRNFTDDKRKYAHVNGMVGINATPGEKELGITRLNWLQLREGAFSETHSVHVAGCLALANPAVKSTW